MCWLNQYINCPAVRSILANDFKCGYAAATAVFLLLIFSILLAKFLIWLACSTPKCSEVVVKRDGGDIIISAKVISALISRELAANGRLNDARITLRKKKAKYIVYAKATYTEGETGLPEIVDTVKPQILELLKNQFGLENISAVNVTVDRLAEPEENGDSGF
jgi:hypothetical protein